MNITRSDGVLHREGDLPAVETSTVRQWWWRGKLHRSNGPAVLGWCGTRSYYLRGLYVPEDIWNSIDSMTVQEVVGMKNAELRRAVMEKIGMAKFLPLCREVDKRPACDTFGAQIPAQSVCGYAHPDDGWAHNRLYMLPLQNDPEPVVFLELVNSTPESDGTFKLYHLRVPPAVDTVREGIGWSMGIEREYEFAFES